MPESPDVCPNCGALVPTNSPNCPDCGSDHETGWSDTATAQRLGLPGDEFDHDEFLRNEGLHNPSRPPIRPKGISWLWWIVALLLLLALLAF